MDPNYRNGNYSIGNNPPSYYNPVDQHKTPQGNLVGLNNNHFTPGFTQQQTFSNNNNINISNAYNTSTIISNNSQNQVIDDDIIDIDVVLEIIEDNVSSQNVLTIVDDISKNNDLSYMMSLNALQKEIGRSITQADYNIIVEAFEFSKNNSINEVLANVWGVGDDISPEWIKKMGGFFQGGKYEGLEDNVAIFYMTEELNSFLNDRLSIIPKEQINTLKSIQTSMSLQGTPPLLNDNALASALYNMWKKGEPVIINSGWIRHSTAVLLYGDKLVKLNRGEGRADFAATVYYLGSNVSEQKMKEAIKNLRKRTDSDTVNDSYFLSNAFGSGLDHDLDLEIAKTFHIQMKDQHMGNCIIASKKAAVFAALHITNIHNNMSEKDSLFSAKKLYKSYTSYIRLNTLKDCYTRAQKDPSSVDWVLLSRVALQNKAKLNKKSLTSDQKKNFTEADMVLNDLQVLAKNNLQNVNKEALMHFFIARGDVDGIKKIIDHVNIDTDVNDTTLLTTAIRSKNIPIIEELIARGAKPNKQLLIKIGDAEVNKACGCITGDLNPFGNMVKQLYENDPITLKLIFQYIDQAKGDVVKLDYCISNSFIPKKEELKILFEQYAKIQNMKNFNPKPINSLFPNYMTRFEVEELNFRMDKLTYSNSSQSSSQLFSPLKADCVKKEIIEKLEKGGGNLDLLIENFNKKRPINSTKKGEITQLKDAQIKKLKEIVFGPTQKELISITNSLDNITYGRCSDPSDVIFSPYKTDAVKQEVIDQLGKSKTLSSLIKDFNNSRPKVSSKKGEVSRLNAVQINELENIVLYHWPTQAKHNQVDAFKNSIADQNYLFNSPNQKKEIQKIFENHVMQNNIGNFFNAIINREDLNDEQKFLIEVHALKGLFNINNEKFITYINCYYQNPQSAWSQLNNRIEANFFNSVN